MSVIVLGGTGVDTVVPVAGLPVLGADSARPTGPIHDGRDLPGFRLPSQVYAVPLAASSHAHVTIVDWARHLLPTARAEGRTVSTDLHDWDGENPYHLDFARGADLVFVSGVQLATDAPARCWPRAWRPGCWSRTAARAPRQLHRPSDASEALRCHLNPPRLPQPCAGRG